MMLILQIVGALIIAGIILPFIPFVLLFVFYALCILLPFAIGTGIFLYLGLSVGTSIISAIVAVVVLGYIGNLDQAKKAITEASKGLAVKS